MFSPGLGQTVAVIDQSGKIVSSGKHIFNLFKEAKFAYQDRKAELAAGKKRGPVRAHTFADDRSAAAASSRRSHRAHGPHPRARDDRERSRRDDRDRRRAPRRRHSDELRPVSRGLPSESPTLVNGARSPGAPPSPTLVDGGYYSPHATPSPRSPARGGSSYFPAGDLAVAAAPRPGPAARAFSTGHIDMDLAYGEPPPAASLALSLGRGGAPGDEAQLTNLVGRARGLLEEADCLKHSAAHAIATLQRNPDALAAVGLTLAEISKLVRRMAPGALLGVRRLCPAVFGLLVSPQFLIAAGVGVGLTVIAFGGFKIVKRLQAQRGREAEEGEEEMLRALPAEVGRIETWRRGIADAEAASVGTSVEGELITPAAAALSRLNLQDDAAAAREMPGRPAYPAPARAHTVASGRSGSARSSRRSDGGERSGARRGDGKERRRSEGRELVRREKGPVRAKTAPKRPSPLRALFS